uniref:Uncharacterized protein n=1 Tax=Anguilla anguilla TaxID=7936 RepID=A0A0E9PIJ5_ANGAN
MITQRGRYLSLVKLFYKLIK